VRRRFKWPLYGAALLAALLALGVGALYWMLARAPQYQTQIKAWVHERTGFYIRFASVDSRLRWLGPELHFDRIELRSKDDAHVLIAARGASIALDFWGLIRSGKLLAGRIGIDSPQIDIERKGPHSFLLASQLELYPQLSDPSGFDLRVLPGGRIQLKNAHVSLHGWNTALPELVLPAVNGDMERTGDLLELDLKTQMPEALKGSLRVHAQARELGKWNSTTWELHAYARDFSLEGWHRLLPEYSNVIDSGIANFDLLIMGRGRALSLSDLNFGAYQVRVPAAAGRATAFDELSGRLSLRHFGSQWSLTARRFSVLQAGRHDAPLQFGANWRFEANALQELSARANALDMVQLTPVVALLPDKGLRDKIGSWELTGRWKDPFVQYRAPHANQPRAWRVNAAFEHVGFAASGNQPGFAGLTGTVSGNERGGMLRLHSGTAVISWPAEWSQPATLDQLNADVAWKRNGEGMLVGSKDMGVKNADFALTVQFAHQSYDDARPEQIVLAAQVQRVNVSTAHRYLPRRRIAPKAMEWLNRALIGGHIPSGQLVLRGPLNRYPFRDGSGLFLARFPIEGLELDYQPGWPRLDHLSVDAEFRNAGLRVHLRHGRVGDLDIDSGDGVFEDFKTGELHVKAAVHGDADATLKFLRASPVNDMAEHAFSTIEARGPVKADVDLFLPFKAFDQRRVLVGAELDQVSVSHPASKLSTTDVEGVFTVDGGQVSSADLRGRVLGGPFSLRSREPRRRVEKARCSAAHASIGVR
jgi:uncharacterized protein YhdP